MNRRDASKIFLYIPLFLSSISLSSEHHYKTSKADRIIKSLPYKKGTKLSVAFVLSSGAEVVDFAGPWGVFEYVNVDGVEGSPFDLFTVAESSDMLKVSGGMKIVPDFTYDNAPIPNIIVIPAMENSNSKPMIDWIKKSSFSSDLIMSVCNGVFVLGETGLLDGKEATSHHGAYAMFAADYPKIKVKRGMRFVDSGNIATSGGLTSGIDLALHIVSRYFGQDIAQETALSLEYQGEGWKHPESNKLYAKKPISTEQYPICPVCEMGVDKNHSHLLIYHQKKYHFCSDWCKKRFLKNPERF